MIRQAVLIASVALHPVVGLAQCSSTPIAAAQAALETKLPSAREGFRATETVMDSQTGRVWVRVIACNHPERPATLVPFGVPAVSLTSTSSTQSKPDVPQVKEQRQIVVHSGDSVRLHFASSGAVVQLEGKAEEQGFVGQTISVRLQSLMGDAAQPSRRVKAVITAPGEAVVQS